jgi:hypothetical protein
MIYDIIVAILIVLLIVISNGGRVNFYYVGLISILIYAFINEKRDFFDIQDTRLKKNIINDGDSKDSAFLKLLYSSEYSKDLIIWRQCYIIAFISAFLIWIILTRKFPDGQTLFITTLIIFIITYCFMNFYQFHLHNQIQERLKNNILYYDNNIKNHYIQ